MTNTVFIVNHYKYDYKSAKEYGDLVYLTRGYIDFKNDKDAINKSIKSLIETASPEDYLLLSGNNLLCVMAFDLWKSIHKKCRLLHTANAGQNYDLYEL